MTDTGEGAPRVQLGRTAKNLARFLLLWLAFGGTAQFFAYHFLPAMEWVAAIAVFACIVSIVLSALVFRFTWKYRDAICGRDRKKNIALFLCPFIVYYFSNTAFILGVPLVVSLVAGYQVEHRYEVQDVTKSNYRRCRNPVDLVGFPFLVGTICSYSDEFRKTLGPGSHVMVSGRGTRYGVFVSDIRKVD